MSMTAQAQATESQLNDSDKEKAQKKQDIVRVVALGWSLVELLGRCFALDLPTPEQELNEKDWDGERMIMISPAFNSQKRLQDLVRFVQTLVENLKWMDGKDQTAASNTAAGKNKTDECFLGTIKSKIDTLYLLNRKDKEEGKDKPLLRDINKCLFYWDIKIREKLQNNSDQFRNNYDFMNAYMVGKGFAALRWYHEPPKEKQEENDTESDSISLENGRASCRERV